MVDREVQKETPGEILIVDDSRESLRLLADILGSRGYRVRPASSGRLALKSIAVRLPDLILLDVKMPAMDGYDVCRCLKSDEKSRDVPVIFISALYETEAKVKGFEAGCVDFITKPFQSEEVLARVHTHLTLRGMQKQLKSQNIQLQERLQLAVDSTELGTWDFDLVTGVGTWSDRCKALFGLPPQAEVDSQTFINRLHPDDSPRIHELVQKAQKPGGGGEFETEYRCVWPDGTERWLFGKGRAFFGIVEGKQRAVRFIGTMLDITERKRAEENLKESRQLLTSIIHGFPIPAFVIGKDHRVIYWNKAMEEMSHIRAAEVLGTNRQWMGFYSTERPCMADLLVEGATSEEIRNRYSGLCDKSGLLEEAYEATEFSPEIGVAGRWFHLMAAPIRDSHGNIAGAIETLKDVTERKLAEDALVSANRQLKDIIEFLPDATLVVDKDKKVIAWNRTIEEMTGVSKEEMIGKGDYAYTIPFYGDRRRHLIDLIDADDEELESKYQHVIRKGGILYAQTYVPQVYGGRGAYVLEAGAPLFDAHGNRVGAIESIRDITEQKLAEEQLRELSQRLSYHVDNSPLAVIEWGPDMRLIRWSGEAERMFGWCAEEVVGKRMEDFHWIYQDHLAQVAEVSHDLRSGANRRRFSANCNYRKDGSVIHCEWHNSSLLDDSGGLRSILSLVLDVSERKQMEDELRKSRDELELRVLERTAELELANEKLRLVPSMLINAQENERQRLAVDLHDSIGQTLAALKYRIEHVIAHLERRESKKAHQLLSEFVPILQRSIDETRAIYMGLKPSILSEYGILATLGWHRMAIMKLYPNQHIELETSIKEEDIPEDLKTTIFRIVQEALNNAHKHGKAEWVDVRLVANGGAIELEISDNGIGMDLDYIMESSTAKSLGLIGMQERTELTGGKFTIKSAPDKGTTIKAVWRNRSIKSSPH